jgi:regulator of protease activity HflC (stomatin/prohibitin superfamily)
MFEKVKGKIGEMADENRRRREERARIAQEKAEEEARIAKEKAEEAARIERERIQAEKDALMALSEKELMVESIMALRGYNTRISSIDEKQEVMNSRLDSLESDVSYLESDVSSLKTTVSDLNNG